MSMLTDVETSKEALEEDGELIEAVEQLVQTAAVAIYKDIRNDLDSMVARIREVVNMLFPFVQRWRNTEGIFWLDMKRCVYSMLLCMILYYALGRPKRKKKGRHNRRGSPTTIAATTSNLVDEPYLRTTRTYSDGDEYVTQCLASGIFREEEREQSDEEKFARNWPSVMDSGYRKLVLPPQCKRVEKSITKERDPPKEKKVDTMDDEDHPVHRLVNYMRHLAMLVVSILRYDYVVAGGYLINWLQACLKRRTKHDGNNPEEFDDDESDVTSSHGSVRRESLNSQVSGQSSVLKVDSKPKRSPRRKRDTVSSRTTSMLVSNDENDTLGSVARLAPLTAENNHHIIQEEKRDEASGHSKYDATNIGAITPPMTPVISDRSESPPITNSAYQTPLSEDCAIQTSLLAEQVALHLSLPSRSAMLPSTKSKDALQHYRSVRTFPAKLREPVELTKAEKVPDKDMDSSSHFFDTASSAAGLQKMAVDIPVPDKHGYILGDGFLPDMSWTPLLVFVNSRSGAQQGHVLINQLKGLLNPIQVWDLALGGPEAVLESFTVLSRFRILVCGGDGTVSWIVSTIENMKLKRWPPIAILPLGTGNDLARIHGWGGGYNNESIIDILEDVSESYVSWLDRWEMTIKNKKGTVKSKKSFFNYLGVGADAQAALQVHMLRESRPQLFFSRIVNKAWYGIFGAEDIIKATSINVPHEIKLIADGVEVPLPSDSQGIILLNIDSYAGGVPLWTTATKLNHQPPNRRGAFKRSRSLGSISKVAKRRAIDRTDSIEDLRGLDLTEEERYRYVTACDRPSSCQDGLLDIVSIRGTFHLGQIRVGLSNAQRLCQCHEARIEIRKKVSVQIDGEPWRQNVSTLHVRRKKDAAMMLHRSATENIGVETEMGNLLDWAQEKEYIDEKVHAAMMKEFSRRIETKTREQRRVESQDNLMHSLKRAIVSSGNFQSEKVSL